MSEAVPIPDRTKSVALGGGLLATKLYARPARTNLIVRPRVHTVLDEGLSASLILVSAPAGFGKTTALAEWLSDKDQRSPLEAKGQSPENTRFSAGRSDNEHPIASSPPGRAPSPLSSNANFHPSSFIPHPSRYAWLSLDSADNDPVRFWAYVILALQSLRDELGETALAQLRSPQPPSAEEILPTLLSEMESFRDSGLLVLDDYHVITSAAVHRSLTCFLENLPPDLHLIISARSDPPLPIAKLRARGQVREVRADELRFTPDEAAAFLNQTMGLALSPEQVASLDERTEGWIAGLQMAALSMRGREDIDGFIHAFAGTHRFIMDYLLEEVLAREPEPVQAFLLQTSILHRLTGPLCDAVVDSAGGQDMLERLEKRNLFVVPLDDDRRWYRYHHLFADLLQARLNESKPNRVAPLLARAAEWCEREGHAAEAIEYSFAAKDYGRAARLIARYWRAKTSEGEIETVWGWLRFLPEEIVTESAAVSIVYCWLLWLKGQVGPIEPHLLDAERALEKAGAVDDSFGSIPAEIAALHSFVARFGHDHEASVAYAERALSLAPLNLPAQISGALHTALYVALASAHEGAGDLEQAAQAYAETIRMGRIGKTATGIAVVFLLGGVLWVLGRLREAETACRQALEYVEEQGMSRLPASGILHVALAEVLVEQNELQAAEDHLLQGLELGRRSGRLNAVHNAAHARMRLCLARQDTGGAMAAVQEAFSALGELKGSVTWGELLAFQAGILVRQGSLTEAAECIEEATRLTVQDRSVAGQMVALVAHRVRLARSEPLEAIAELTRSLIAAEESGRMGVAIELRILRSLAYARQRDTQRAEADVERALFLAEPAGYMRLFLDEGEPMQRLLTGWLAHAGPGRLHDYVSRLLSQFDARAPAPALTSDKATRIGDLIEPLTPRELEVLRLICTGESNQAIADKLVITVSAVKKHTGNILGKLGVTNRAQAIVKAHGMGLFPKIP